MRLLVGIFMCVGGIQAVWGDSFLKPATFPKTFADLPFQVRMDIIAEGYADVETLYDENGRCISGCAYPGITIEKETDAITRNTRMAYNAAQAYDASLQTQKPQPQSTDDNLIPSGPHMVYNYDGYNCLLHRNAKRTEIPDNSPVDVAISVSSDFGPRRAPTGNATSWHKGIDISVPYGTPVYATADGTIEYIKDQGTNGGGKYIVVKHTNPNFRTSYMHLSNNTVLKVGDFVHAGCLIGYSGNSGVSTGPHLHYTVYYTAPDKKFAWASDAIDPLWTKNYLGSGYMFKSQSVKSCLHNPHNFCARESGTSQIPPETLPGEIR